MAKARAAVVGSGIAGIAIAHALRGVGLEAELFEQTHESRSTGYQLNVLGNGMYALARIGLRDALLESGFGAPMRAATIVDGESGRVIRTLPPTGLGTPYAPRSYYRGDLHRAILGGLAGDPPQCDCEVAAVSQDGATTSLRLANGQERSFDLVVAADGARSRIRR